ncbi:MAG: RNA polymerase sigma factor [Bacteroidota bacterium]
MMEISRKNPLSSSPDEQANIELINQAIAGSRKALNQLLEIHNQFIFNIAIKMIGDVERAKDMTQDILIKITTNLAKYDAQKGAFTPWLYRLAFNYILDQKKSKTENNIKSFSQFFNFIDDVPDQLLSDGDSEESEIYSRETKIKCTTGMLMCLSREDRLLYVVGELFQIDHNLGSTIFDISKDNFRKKLSRIRKDLYQWMNNRCGLVNTDNPCRCKKKTKGFIERGIVDPDKLIWNDDFKHRIEDFTSTKLEELQISADQAYATLYREHPMKEQITTEEVISAVLGDKNLREMIDL